MKYNVFVNGKNIETQTARVSAVPMNRVWSGKQRPQDQTEIAYFVNFDMDSSAHIKVEVLDADIKKAEIRPLHHGLPFEISGNTISFVLEEPMCLTLEINGYHEALHIFANEPYLYEKREDDIYFGPGVHHAGVIAPHSNQRVIVDKGALVYGIVYIDNAENVRVEGRGIIDASIYRRGNDKYTDDESCDVIRGLRRLGFDDKKVYYSGIVNACHSKNVVIDGVILRDAPMWVLILRNNCDHVLINNIKIIGQWRYNSDGVDICASKNVVLKNSFIRSFDDSVVVRGAYLDGEKDGCSHIVVKNNVLWCDWGKNLEIWSGDKDSEIKNILFENNYLIHVQMTAISIDTWFGSRRIVVENVLYDGVYVEHDDERLLFQFQQTDSEKYNWKLLKNSEDHNLIYIAVSSLGKNAGNQKCELADDISGYDVRYRNIEFENITQTGSFRSCVNIIEDRVSELSNITINGVDYKEYALKPNS